MNEQNQSEFELAQMNLVQKELYLKDSANLKNKNEKLLDRISDAFDRQTNRQTRYSSIVYKLECNSENVDQARQLLAKCKDSRISRISLVNENKENPVDNRINKEDEDIKEKEKEDINNDDGNKNLVILIEVDQEDAESFKDNFERNKKTMGFNDLNLEKNQELCTVDLGKDESYIPLTSKEEQLIGRLNSKKFWILKTMSAAKQADFVDKLIKLAGDEYKSQRAKLVDWHDPKEYRYFLNLIFNSGCLTFSALSKLADFVSKRKISHKSFTSVYEEIKTTWDNVFQDLGYRDISGKRDRLRVMIGPEFQAKIIAYHIKLFNYLGDNKSLRKGYYQTAIQIAKDEYSKASREFWSNFLLYVVGLSFLITLAGAIVTALVGLSGFAALAPCAVILVTTLIKTGSKFHTDYKIWPWDWVYWWKDAKGNCLKVLQSDYMKQVLINGNTEMLDQEIRKGEREEKENINILKNDEEEIEEKNYMNIIENDGNEVKDVNNKIKNNPADDKITKLKSQKKRMKDERKLYRFLFRLCMVILAVSVMIAFFPSVVATAIPLVLSVFELEVAFTIAPLVSGIFLWIAMAAMIAAVVFSVMQSDCCGKYQQLKFETYKAYIAPDSNKDKGDKYFMKLNGNHKFYTKEELEAHGIEVEEKAQKEIKLDNN